MGNRIKQLYAEKREAVLYLVFGALTTAVNYAVYFALRLWLQMPYLWANSIAWVLAVAFAYATNRCFVFQSRAKGAAMLKEGAGFFCKPPCHIGRGIRPFICVCGSFAHGGWFA